MNTLTGREDALTGFRFAFGGGKWYVRQNDWTYDVIGQEGNVIGRASRHGQGWIIETKPYSGFAFDDEVEVEVTDERR